MRKGVGPDNPNGTKLYKVQYGLKTLYSGELFPDSESESTTSFRTGIAKYGLDNQETTEDVINAYREDIRQRFSLMVTGKERSIG